MNKFSNNSRKKSSDKMKIKDQNTSVSVDTENEPMFNFNEYCKISFPKDTIPWRKEKGTNYYPVKVVNKNNHNRYQPFVYYTQA